MTRRLGSRGFTTVELLIVTVVLAVFLSAALDQVMSSFGAGAAAAVPFILLAVIGEKRQWPGFPALGVILGVLAGGAVGAIQVAKVAADPKSHHARLMRKAREGGTLGSLSDARAVVKAYRDGHGGRPPADLGGMPPGRAMLPPYHPDSAAVRVAAVADDAGGWLYDPARGQVSVNCAHTDTKGSVWSAY